MKLTKAQLKQAIEEELTSEGFFDRFTKKGRAKQDEEERAQRAEKAKAAVERLASRVNKTLSDETKALAIKLILQDEMETTGTLRRQMHPLTAIEQAQKKRGEPTWAEERDAVHQKYLARRRGGPLPIPADPHSRPQSRRRSSDEGRPRNALGEASAYYESKDHTMKLNKDTLAQMIKEELEVILTDEEAVEMFGLENILALESIDDMLAVIGHGPKSRIGPKVKKKKADDPDSAKEDDDNDSLARKTLRGISQVGTGLEEDNESGIFAPNHYCVHHGGVMHEGEWKQAEAVNHNFNEELNRVTHYDMQLADGTVLENIAFEDIQVTNASLAEGHEGHTAKRDDGDDEEPLKEVEKEVNESKATKPRMKENNLFMTRDKLAEMIRQEMTRTVRRNKENA